MKPAGFLKKHSKPTGKYLQLNERLLEEIAGIKLPFTSKNYNAFCDKYLGEDVDEALYLDWADKHFREIATDYETLRYIYFIRTLCRVSPMFCDIGCGIGNVVKYAARMGYRAFGFEINPELKPVHKKIKAEVVYADILTAALTRLEEVDVIYLYRPINDTRKMNKMFARIHEHSNKDIVIVYNYPHAKLIKGYRTILLGPYDDTIILVKDRAAR